MTMTDEGVLNTDQVDVDRLAQQLEKRDLSMENICNAYKETMHFSGVNNALYLSATAETCIGYPTQLQTKFSCAVFERYMLAIKIITIC